jgi:dihydrodipicolinate synthase/N-acetylneuraminate lyase
VKAALELLGRPAGPMRLPLAPLDDAVRSAVAEVLAGLGLARG